MPGRFPLQHDGASGGARRALPPWPIVVCVVVLIVVRAVSSQLSYSFVTPWQYSALEIGMGLTLFSFWFWPPHPRQPRGFSWLSLRLASQLGLAYLLLLPLCERACGSNDLEKWMLLHRPAHFFLLSHPFARLLAQLRLDARRPVHEILGPTALFLFWGLMLPAGLQVLRDDAPRALTAMLVVVPIATLVLLIIYFKRGAGDEPWWRALGRLCLRYWSLPVLFALGELCLVMCGVLATLD